MTKRFAMAAMVVCVLSSALMASEISYLGMGLKDTSKVYYEPSPFDGQNVYVGQIRLDLDGEEIMGYCADAAGRATGSAYTVEFVSPSEFAGERGEQAAWLYATYADDVTTKTDAAGLQAAIWEVLHETTDTLDLFHGSERAGVMSLDKASVATKGMDYLSNLSDWTTVSGVTFLRSNDTSRQSMIIPEPAALAMLIPGAFLMAIRRNRK